MTIPTIIVQVAPWMPLIIMMLLSSFLALNAGSIAVANQYRRKPEENRGIMPCKYSLCFSVLAACIIFFLTVWFLFGAGILMKQSFKASLVIVLVGVQPVFLSLIIVCEWILRKMIRHREPNIRFERWMFLK